MLSLELLSPTAPTHLGCAGLGGYLSSLSFSFSFSFSFSPLYSPSNRLSTFPSLWERTYHESVGLGGLNYISLGIGFFLGTQICAPINDRIYRKLKMRNNNIGRPEFRVPLMIPGACLVPIGLFIYGWTSFYQTHWIVPNIGAAIFAAGTVSSPFATSNRG